MTNRHFGRISEVWKHIVLAEVLRAEQPRVVLDTHAGDALYPLVEDPERQFGVLGFNQVLDQESELQHSAYATVLYSLRTKASLVGIPGGPLVAMAVLGDRAEYLFCDLDQRSAKNVREVATHRGLHSARVLAADGMESVHHELARHDPTTVVVFIDPFDHHVVGSVGLSALDVAVQAAHAGAVLVYWYGYNRVDQRAWILHQLVERDAAPTLWCGDLMVIAEGEDMSTGDLGVASSPGTGSGLVCANISPATAERCTALGIALAATYRNRHLPSGSAGALDFLAIYHRAAPAGTAP